MFVCVHDNIGMVRGYKQEQVLDAPSDNCTIYRVSKEGHPYLMHEFENINDSDEYTFRVRKKLVKCSHLVSLVEEFQENDNKYFVSEYIDSDLLKLAHSRPGHVLQLAQALPYVAELVETLEELHSSKLVLRNMRPEKVRVKNGRPYLYDFSLSQFLKRKEKLFEVVGCASFLAPDYYSEDGYGPEVDIWALGVLFFYLLLHEYPFHFKGDSEEAFKEEFKLKCQEGFSFGRALQQTNFDAPPLKGNKQLEDFFRKIFALNPHKRLGLLQLKQHPLFESYFPKEIDPEMLEVIQESGRESSIFLSKMYKFPCSRLLHKEEIILDFIEETSELFLLECPEIYSEELRYRSQFAVLKVGLLKCRDLLEVTYGKRAPSFLVDPQEWQAVRLSTALHSVKEKFQKKEKILKMIYKSAFMKVDEMALKDLFFREQLPQTFEDIKIAYRGNLSEMFETGRKSLAKAKGNRRLSRKLTESLVRVIILFLVNRLFENEEQISIDFSAYLKWSKRGDLEDLQEWIQAEELANLKVFMKSVTSKYLS